MPRYRTAEGECTNIFQPIAHIHHNAQHLWLKMGERKWKCTLKKSIFPFWAATMEIPESGLRLVSHCTVGLRPSANDLATLPYFGDIGHNILCKCTLCLCTMGNTLCLCILYNILVHPRTTLPLFSTSETLGTTSWWFTVCTFSFSFDPWLMYTMKIVYWNMCCVLCLCAVCPIGRTDCEERPGGRASAMHLPPPDQPVYHLNQLTRPTQKWIKLELFWSLGLVKFNLSILEHHLLASINESSFGYRIGMCYCA